MQAALDDVEGELREIERARIRRRLEPEELDRMERSAENRRDELVARLDAASPEHRADIDRLKQHIAGARDMLEIARRKKVNGDRMQKFNVNPDYAMSDEALSFVGSIHWPLTAKSPQDVQQALKIILDRINARLTVYEDRVEIEGLLPVRAALNPSTSGRELEGG